MILSKFLNEISLESCMLINILFDKNQEKIIRFKKIILEEWERHYGKVIREFSSDHIASFILIYERHY